MDGLLCWACGDRGCPECMPEKFSKKPLCEWCKSNGYIESCEDCIYINVRSEIDLTPHEKLEYNLAITTKALQDIKTLIEPYKEASMKEQAIRAIIALFYAETALAKIGEANNDPIDQAWRDGYNSALADNGLD